MSIPLVITVKHKLYPVKSFCCTISSIMLKRLAMLGGSVLIVAAILMAAYYQQRNAVGEGYNVECAQPSQPSPAVNSLVCVIHPGQNADQGKPKAPWWDILLAWPEAITAWLLLLTLGAIVWQSVATAKAAKAALLNARALINAERPWIVVSVEEFCGPNNGFLVYAKNKGRTPAMILSARFGCVAVNSIEALPEHPPYKQGTLVQDHIAITGDDLSVGFFDFNKLKKMAGTESAPLAWEKPWIGNIFVFGIVLYRDLLDPSQKEIHETRWIFQYVPPQGNSGDRVITMQGIGIPKGYDGYS
jgi:hypothetical protein